MAARAFEPVGVEFVTRGLAGFKRDLRDAQTEVVGLGKNTEQTGTQVKGFTENLHSAAQGAKGAVVVFGALAAVGGALIGKTVMVAARHQELAIVLQTVGKNAGVSSQYLAEQEEKIKDLGITTSATRSLMVRFMQSELDVADATKLARVAQDLAVISMQDSSAAAETLTHAIVSQRPILLKQFGITKTLNQIYGEYATETLGMAEATGNLSSVLTPAQKKAAFLAAILKEGAKVAGTYEAAMGTAGKQMRSFSRYTEEISAELGRYFLPYLTDAVFLAAKVAKGILAMSDATKGMTAQIILYGTAAFTAIAGVGALIVAVDMLAVHITVATGGIALLAGALALLAVHFVKTRLDAARLNETIKEQAETWDDVIEGFNKANEEMPTVSRNYNRLGTDTQKLIREQQAQALASEWQIAKFEEIDMSLRREQKEYEDLAFGVAEYTEEMQRANTERTLALGLTVGKVTLDVREGIAAYRELQDASTAVTADLSSKTYDLNQDLLKISKDRAAAETKLLEQHAYDLWYIEAGGMSRSAEATEELYQAQLAANVLELADFNATWGAKELTRQTDYDNAVGIAQAKATEESRIAEEARAAEMEAIRVAQVERLTLFALEMLEHKNALQVPLEGWEDMEITAQEYYDLVKAGVIPVTDTLTNNMGVALSTLTGQWGGLETRSTEGLAAIELQAGQTFDLLAGLPEPTTAAVDEITESYLGLGTKLGELEGGTAQFYNDLALKSETLTMQTGEDVAAMSLAASEWQEGIGVIMETNYLKITTEWNRAWTDVYISFLEHRAKILTAVEKLVSDIFKTFFEAEWAEIGRHIIEGVTKGIKEECSQAVAAARACAERINAAMQGATESSSPSRVGYRLGQDIIRGVALGIRSMAAFPAIEAQAATQSALASVSTSTVTNYNTLQISTNAAVEPMAQDWDILMTMSAP